MDSKIPFAESKEFSIPFPDESSGKADVFVDDIISVTADVGDNLSKLKKAPCTVIHALSHKPSKDLKLKRDDMICDIKNQVEGAPAEEQICLGWILDSRRLLVSLPKHKYTAWLSQLNSIVDSKSISLKTLLSIMGRLENVAVIMPMMGHFLNNIRHLCLLAELSVHNVRVTKRAKDDLELCKK